VKTNLERRVAKHILSAEMLIPGDRVGVAVSGGADSVALFRLLENLRDRLGITLFIIHFDHCLRGPESDADAKFVETLARNHSVEFICERADVAAVADKDGLNLEDAARRLRYAAFERMAAKGRATRVVVAHTMDDQAETVLARLFRGTGPTGLAGIYPIVGMVVRPLLEVRRKQLREYLRELHQMWREDSTNTDLAMQRAHIRAQLLPTLERDFSPSIVKHLGELARLSREEAQFWEVLVESRFRATAREANRQIAIQIRELLCPLGLQSAARDGVLTPFRPLTERLVRRLYKGIRGDCKDLTALHVEQVLHLSMKGASGQQVQLPGRVLVQRTFDELMFSYDDQASIAPPAEETNSRPAAYHYLMTVPRSGTTSISIPELGTRFLLKVIDWSSPERDTSLGDALDADLLPSTFILRNWQPGDAYRPRGRRQSRKLKEMFLSQRVPSRERVYWPVIESGGKIIWARGMPPAGDFCVRDQTRLGIVIDEKV
jgi:tRNA(Ile)-lysidine synthase